MINYKIIDNFLSKDDFLYLSKLNLEKVNDNNVRIYNNSIFNNGETKTSCLSEKFINDLHEKYHKITIKILEELKPEKLKFYDYSEFHIIKTGKNFNYPIHNDVPDKLLSGVIYLHPENNKGTIFYNNKNGDKPKEIRWKQNSALFFSRGNDTWHSFSGDGVSHRIVLIYNLMTNDIKKISEIDNFNYSFYQIKFFLEKITQKIQSLF